MKMPARTTIRGGHVPDGVAPEGGRFYAGIMHRGKRHYLGVFDDCEDAFRVYEGARKTLIEFAALPYKEAVLAVWKKNFGVNNG